MVLFAPAASAWLGWVPRLCSCSQSAAIRHACSACSTRAASELSGVPCVSCAPLLLRLPKTPSLLAAAANPGLLPLLPIVRSHWNGDGDVCCWRRARSAVSSASPSSAAAAPSVLDPCWASCRTAGPPGGGGCGGCGGLPRRLASMGMWKPQLLLCCGAAAACGETGGEGWSRLAAAAVAAARERLV